MNPIFVRDILCEQSQRQGRNSLSSFLFSLPSSLHTNASAYINPPQPARKPSAISHVDQAFP